jgi:RIO-like serine/threonine protein kinase
MWNAVNLRISQQDHSVLCAISDWKAPFEVVAALYPGRKKVLVRERVAIERSLNSLHRRGLAKYSKPNNTYAITDAGRAMLAAAI